MQPTLADLEGPGMHAVVAALRAVAPVSRVESIGGWLVSGYRAAIEILQDPDSFTVDDPRFSTAQVVGPSMLSLDGADHRRHRSPFAPMFRPGAVRERYSGLVEQHVADLLGAVGQHGTADLRLTLTAPLAASVMADLLGIDGGPQAVLEWYAAIVGAVTDITAGRTPHPRARTAMSELRAAVAAAGGLAGVDRGAADLTDDDVASNAAVVLFGGVDTVDGAVANVLAHVLSRPELGAAVRADHRLAGPVVEESLRLEPAASVVDRYATTDVLLDGIQIRRGDLVRISLAGANRDPEVFPDPDAFVIGRSNVRSQLSFARGPHACIAMELARLEATIALRTVLHSLPDVRLAGPAEIRGLVFRKPVTLPVTWIPVRTGPSPGSAIARTGE